MVEKAVRKATSGGYSGWAKQMMRGGKKAVRKERGGKTLQDANPVKGSPVGDEGHCPKPCSFPASKSLNEIEAEWRERVDNQLNWRAKADERRWVDAKALRKRNEELRELLFSNTSKRLGGTVYDLIPRDKYRKLLSLLEGKQ